MGEFNVDDILQGCDVLLKSLKNVKIPAVLAINLLQNLRNTLHDSGVIPAILLYQIEEYIWEEIHSVHWKDVPLEYRDVYSFVSYLSIVHMQHDDIAALIHRADLGILMGSSFYTHKLQELIHQYTEQFKIRNIPLVSTTTTEKVVSRKRRFKNSFDHIMIVPSTKSKRIQRNCDSVGLESFVHEFMGFAIPVVFEGIIDHWPALERWKDLQYFKQNHGLRVVPIEMGISYLSEDSGQILIPISEFVDKYILGSDGIAYLAQHPIFDQIIDLEDDIDIPAFCYLLPLSEHHTISNDDDLDSNIISQIWFGASGGSYSPLHHDPYHNMLAQVIGYKYIRLYTTSQSDYLYPLDEETSMTNNSGIDFTREDWEDAYPLHKYAEYSDTVLGPGETLFIPRWCWHLIISVDEYAAREWRRSRGMKDRSASTAEGDSHCISVSFWWGDRIEKNSHHSAPVLVQDKDMIVLDTRGGCPNI